MLASITPWEGFAGWITVFVWCCFGTAMVVKWGWKNVALAKASLTWPKTAGAILSSQIGVDSDADGTAYRALVRYSYRVDSTDYEGTRISAGSERISELPSGAERAVARYPQGATVEVAYWWASFATDTPPVSSIAAR